MLSVPAGVAAAVIEGFVFGGEIVCDGIAGRKPAAHFLDAFTTLALFCGTVRGIGGRLLRGRGIFAVFFVKKFVHTLQR